MDLFSTNYLTGVVNSLQTPPQFLVDTFFPGVQTETAEEIHFDVEADVMGLAPFVSPVVEGKVMTNLGYTTKTFKPAYIKPKNIFEATRALKRVKGEALTGSLSPEQRMQMLVAETVANHQKLIRRRLEWMASSVLRTGGVTISGDLYQTTAISFGRDSALTVTLSGGSTWNTAGTNPLDDLQTWADLILQKSGSQAVNVVLELNAWKAFRANSVVKERLNVQRASTQMPTLTQNAINMIGGTYVGTLDSFNIWVYSGYYKDDTGMITPMLPSGTVIMAGAVEGVEAYGAILDEDAGIQALPYFTKSWKEPDPGRRYVMTQSAPLLVPYRPNASLCATVL